MGLPRISKPAGQAVFEHVAVQQVASLGLATILFASVLRSTAMSTCYTTCPNGSMMWGPNRIQHQTLAVVAGVGATGWLTAEALVFTIWIYRMQVRPGAVHKSGK